MNSRLLCLFFFQLLSTLLLPRGVQAQQGANWQRWGGPNANQVSTESDWETDWTRFPPRQVWKAEIGVGFSGITLFGDKLFTAGRDGENDAVLCLERRTGKEIWKYTYPTPLADKQHEGGPGATPTHYDGIVYMLSRAGLITALDAEDGELIWEVDTPALTESKRAYWGFTSSPLVINDKVIFDVGCLLALDRKSGQFIWKTENHSPGYGSITQFQEGKRIVALTNDGLLMVEEQSGDVVAETKWVTSHPTNATTPIIDGDLFFVSSGYQRGCGLFRFENDKFEQVYRSRHMSNHMANSVLHDGQFYGINGNSHLARNCTLTCIRADSGKKVWSERGFGCGSVLLAGEHLLILSDQGELTCAKASPDGFVATGKIKAVDGKCWTAGSFCNRRLYCRTASGELACWEMVAKKSEAQSANQ